MHRRLLLIHIIALLISCGPASKTGTLKVLRFNASNNISSLDPALASTQDNIWAVSQIFNGLIELDDQLKPIPAIAKSWEIKDSATTYVFHLRTDVFFHDHFVFDGGKGRLLNSKDILYSLQRITNPETASPGAWIFNGRLAEKAFETPDDSTFIIHLQKPFAPFLSVLSMPYCSAVPKEAIDHFGKSFGRNPVGTGPFTFKEWIDDVKLILLQNKNYYENGLPHLDGLSISFIRNKQTAFMEFVQGKLDFFNGIESSFKDEIIDAEGNLGAKLSDKCDLIKGAFLNTEYLAFYLDSSSNHANRDLILNKSFREALNKSIDRKKMIQYLRNNVGEAADGGFIPKGLPSYHAFAEDLYGYQLEEAQNALDNSNYQGQTLRLSTTKDYLDLCIFVQSQWREIGVKCEIDVLPSSIMKRQKRHGELELFRASWIADYADGENFLSCFYSANHAPNGPNYTHFTNKRFDAMYKHALDQAEDSTKIELYKAMDELLMSEYPIIPLFYDESVWLKAKNVQNLRLNPLKIPKFKWVEMVD